MVKAFWNLLAVNPGLNPEHLLTMHVSLPPARYTTAAQADGFWSALIARIRALPGVESASIASGLPPMRTINANTTPLENVDVALGGPTPTIDYWNFVDSGYFRTIGARLIVGRLLTPGDGQGAPPWP